MNLFTELFFFQLTTFVSDDLPLNCMPTAEVDAFLKENVGTDAIVVPRGKERMSKWPSLKSREFELEGNEVCCVLGLNFKS